MRHIEIIPDCPKCGQEMNICTRGNEPFDEGHPFGSTFSAWYRCFKCGHTTVEITKDSRYEAIKAVESENGYSKTEDRG